MSNVPRLCHCHICDEPERPAREVAPAAPMTDLDAALAQIRDRREWMLMESDPRYYTRGLYATLLDAADTLAAAVRELRADLAALVREDTALVQMAKALCEQYSLTVDAEREGWTGRCLRELAALQARTCASCVHWEVAKVGEPHTCESPMIGRGYGNRIPEIGGAHVENDEGWGIYTDAAFNCNAWQAREGA